MATDWQQKNIIVSKLVLELTRNIALQYLGTDLFAASSGDVLLCVAVCLGQGEGRPMTAAKLAGFIGMPRPTVIRRLADLRARGLLTTLDGGRWVFAPDQDGKSRRSTSLNNENIRLLTIATAALSKLDSKPIAQRDGPTLNGA